MGVEDDILETVETVVAEQKEQLTFAGTISTVTPLTVAFDGTGSPVPCTAFSDVVLEEGTRCTILKVGSDFVIAGTFAQPGAEAAAQTIGNGSATAFVINHGLNTRDVFVQVYDLTTFIDEDVQVARTSPTSVTVTFENAPATNSKRVVVRV